jgi:hypothetical protein
MYIYMVKTRKACPQGKIRSTNDKNKRCVKFVSRSTCNKIGKEFNSSTRKCRIKCKSNQMRQLTKRKRCIKRK